MKITGRRTSMMLIGGLLLAGCATIPHQSDIAEAPVVHGSMRDFNYTALRIGDDLSVRMDREHAEAYVFDTGKSYFRAFELPSPTKPYHVVVESFASGDGHYERYVYQPTLVTLDKDFHVVRISRPDAFRPQLLGTSEGIGHVGFQLIPEYKLAGQMPFASGNAREKYLIVLETGEALKGFSDFPRSGGWEPLRIQHSSNGAIAVSVVSSADLLKNYRDTWKRSYNIRPRQDEVFQGRTFSVSPPKNPGYLFKDLSYSAYGEKISFLDFAMYRGGSAARAFVKDYKVGSYYVDKNPEVTLSRLLAGSVKRHKQNLADNVIGSSTVMVDGMHCGRIDFFGKNRELFLLPTRGIEILCIHPDQPNTVVQIGASYVYELGEDQRALPIELKDFHEGVRFKRMGGSRNH